MIIFIAFAALSATLLGGTFALRFKDKLHLILGFSAGAVIAVAFFDLLPEALNLGAKNFSNFTITSMVALGFAIYLILDRLVVMHHHGHADPSAHEEHSHEKGVLGAGSLAIHSFLDGIAIGLAFQVSSAVGAVVAVAVLVHDFSDGINTVNLILKNNGDKKMAKKWLWVDAVAPVLGVCSTFFFTLPESALSMALSLFAGFFLYIGASDLLPESHHSHPTKWTTLMTLAGIVVLFLAIKLASI